jgi:hypothetical protein
MPTPKLNKLYPVELSILRSQDFRDHLSVPTELLMAQIAFMVDWEKKFLTLKKKPLCLYCSTEFDTPGAPSAFCFVRGLQLEGRAVGVVSGICHECSDSTPLDKLLANAEAIFRKHVV